MFISKKYVAMFFTFVAFFKVDHAFAMASRLYHFDGPVCIANTKVNCDPSQTWINGGVGIPIPVGNHYVTNVTVHARARNLTAAFDRATVSIVYGNAAGYGFIDAFIVTEGLDQTLPANINQTINGYGITVGGNPFTTTPGGPVIVDSIDVYGY